MCYGTPVFETERFENVRASEVRLLAASGVHSRVDPFLSFQPITSTPHFDDCNLSSRTFSSKPRFPLQLTTPRKFSHQTSDLSPFRVISQDGYVRQILLKSCVCKWTILVISANHMALPAPSFEGNGLSEERSQDSSLRVTPSLSIQESRADEEFLSV